MEADGSLLRIVCETSEDYVVRFTLQDTPEISSAYSRTNEIAGLRKDGRFAGLASEERLKIEGEAKELEKRLEFYSNFCRNAASAFSNDLWTSRTKKDREGKETYHLEGLPTAPSRCDFTTDAAADKPVKIPYAEFSIPYSKMELGETDGIISSIISRDKEFRAKTEEELKRLGEG